MIQITLEKILSTQDMGKKGIDKIIDSIVDNSYEWGKDHVTDIIVAAFDDGAKDADDVITDIDYAISQLSRAKRVIEETHKTEIA